MDRYPYPLCKHLIQSAYIGPLFVLFLIHNALFLTVQCFARPGDSVITLCKSSPNTRAEVRLVVWWLPSVPPAALPNLSARFN